MEVKTRTKKKEKQKKGKSDTNKNIKFTNQVPKAKSSTAMFVNTANKLDKLAKFVKISDNDKKNAFIKLNQFMETNLNVDVDMKTLVAIKNIIFDKGDQESEDELFNYYLSSQKDGKPKTQIQKEASIDYLYQKWSDVCGQITSYNHDILAAAQSQNLFSKPNDGTDNLSEEVWKSILKINSGAIQIKVSNEIKKEKVDDEVKNPEHKNANALTDEEKKKKAEIVEKFKKIRQNKNTEVMNVIDNLYSSISTTNELLSKLTQLNKEEIIPLISDKNVEMWKKIASLNPCEPFTHVQNLIQSCMTASSSGNFLDNGIFMKITYSLISIVNRINNVCQCIKSLQESVKALCSKDIEIAKGGKKTFSNINKRMLFNFNVAKGSVKYVDKENWKKFSIFDKVKNNFQFSDYNQMPNKKVWKRFSDEEKELFLKNRNSFRSKRILELANLADKNPIEALTLLDKLIYYQWRDRFGFECRVNDDVKNKYKDSDDDNVIINGLYDKHLALIENKKLLYNVFFFNGIKKFTNGRRIDSVIDFMKKKGGIFGKRSGFPNNKIHMKNNYKEKFNFNNNNFFDLLNSFNNFNNNNYRKRNFRHYNKFLGHKNNRSNSDNQDNKPNDGTMNLDEEEQNF